MLILLNACATSGYQHTRFLVAGNEAAQKGNFVDAVSNYEKALSEVPDSSTGKRNLGIVLVKIADYDRALGLLRAVEKDYASDSELHYFLGEALRGQRNFELAAKSYQDGLRLDPGNLRLTKALAWTWHKMGRNDWVINLIGPYVGLKPNDRQIQLILASAYNASGKFDKAIALLTSKSSKSARSNSITSSGFQAEDMLIWTALGDGYAGKGDCASAQPLYIKVLRVRPFFDSALVGSAKCHLAAKNPKAAVPLLERAIKSNPESAEGHFFLGRVLEGSETDRAMVYLNRFLAMTESNPSANRSQREMARRSVARAARSQSGGQQGPRSGQ